MKTTQMPLGAIALLLVSAFISPVFADQVLIKNATVWTQGPAGRLDNADLLFEDGKILKVGSNLSAGKNAQVIDVAGKHVTPGLIDCHSHTAGRGGINEGSNNITAEVKIADILNPEDVNLYRQLAGGLTTAHVLHGSANSVGGQDAVIKLRWNSKDRSLLLDDAPGGIKFALGENPKRSNFRVPGMQQRYPATRMGVMESIRERFIAARDYMQEWERYSALSTKEKQQIAPPRRDLQLDAMAEILRGKRLVHSHSYRQDEILALIRLADEFDFTIGTFQHVLEGYKVADELAAHGAGASTFSDWWAYKLEAYDAIPFNGALMHDRDVLVSFNSDSGELARRMNLEAAKAIKYGGVDPIEALNFVTLNAAKQLKIEARVGSLEAGKDADIVIWSGDPLSTYSIAEQTWVDGVKRFDRGADLIRRDEIAQLRAELIERVKIGDKKKKADSDDETDAEEEEDKEEAEETAEVVAQPPSRKRSYTDRLAPLASSYSIVHAEIHSGDGTVIENGTLSFEGGKIVAIGADLPPLEGATVIDASGKRLYPGLIDANTVVGLTEIGSVAGSVDTSETGEMNPNVHAAMAVNPDSELIPVTRANGLTHVVVAPSGGLISGRSTLIRLDGWTWEDLTASANAGLNIRWPSFGGGRSRFGGGGGGGNRDERRKEEIASIDQLLDDARGYALVKKAGSDHEVNPILESLLPILSGDVPVILHASEIRQIKSALDWAKDQEFRVILAGSGDVWRVADRLAKRQIPVILTGVLALPTRRDEAYDVRFTEANKLREAGVTFCIATGGSGFAASSTRNLPYHAAMAAAFGLPRDEALKAVTLYPAQILGVGDQLGSLEIGKSASLMITDGDPLEITTQVDKVFIDGRLTNPDNKHRRLYEKYSGRPTIAAN
jgi:imidazolonepropionase-like amidohydrolase